MEYKFTEIFDIPTLKRICEGFTQYSGIVTALLDLDGNVHIATGWQDICTNFHRVHPKTATRCTESDTILAGQLEKGKSYNVYLCKNGLVDVAIPVLVNREHAGNFYTGQFFLEPPDVEYFRAQAQEFGFNEQEYMEALSRVPVFTTDQVKKTMDFLVELTQLIGEMGLERLKILQSARQNRDKLERLVAHRTHQLTETKEALEKANKELFDLARLDSLTKIYNRRAYEEFADTEWRRAVRSGRPLSILLIDVDHFKLYNDHYGHLSGDNCLIRVADVLRRSLSRPSDFLARYGGEEFICVLSETPLEGALQVAKSIRDLLKKIKLPHEVSPIDPYVTLSIGVAGCHPKDCDKYHDLISIADQCLYQAKRSGRNRIVSQQVEAPLAPR